MINKTACFYSPASVVYLIMDYFITNGKLSNTNTLILSPDSRGLRFGDGLFETLKSEAGEPELLKEHLARLWKGMQVLQFNIPKHFTQHLLEEEIKKLLNKNRHLQKARIRITVYRGGGGLYDEADHKPEYLIQTWPLRNETGSWNSNGLVLGIYPDLKKNFDILSGLKHNNFLLYVMAALRAKKEKWNDAIILNTQGRLCETTIANIFLIKDETVYTPALEEACIEGIMRRHIIGKLKTAGFTLKETALTVADLETADEVFLSNSVYNIRWVAGIEHKQYKCAMVQKIYAALFATKA